MKANEFFKKVGIEAVRSYVAAYEDHLTDELKRLVESHELVEKMGGLNGAKNSLSLLESSLAIGLYHGVAGANPEAQISELKQAIADVESCMEVSSESN